MNIILGSQSASRKKILEEHGVVFETMSSDIDEKAIRDPAPEKLVLKLAHAKADALLHRIFEPSLLITSDQVVVCNGEILEKPESEDEERRYLALYSEYPSETVTSVVVTNTQSGERKEGVDIAQVWYRPFPQEFIDMIVKEPWVYVRAGGYGVEHPLFEEFVERIEGDKESIVGLPWNLTKKLLDCHSRDIGNPVL